MWFEIGQKKTFNVCVIVPTFFCTGPLCMGRSEWSHPTRSQGGLGHKGRGNRNHNLGGMQNGKALPRLTLHYSATKRLPRWVSWSNPQTERPTFLPSVQSKSSFSNENLNMPPLLQHMDWLLIVPRIQTKLLMVSKRLCMCIFLFPCYF